MRESLAAEDAADAEEQRFFNAETQGPRRKIEVYAWRDQQATL
jgi:hypothetical protein